MAQIAHAVFAQAAPEPASWEAGADALLRQLLHVFNEKTLQRALTIVDQGTRRVLFQVKGQAVGEVYTCFPSHFCACHAFFYETVSKGETTCKHQLAASLAHTLGRCNVYEVSDVEFARLMELGCE